MSKNSPNPFAAASRRHATIAAAIACLAAAGCAGVAPGQGGQPDLTGTAWQLAAFQPAQAGAGALQPSRSDQFRLQFDAAGRLLARLDCNRGSGSWQAPADGGAAGSLRIGPVASTKMMCPPDPLSFTLPASLDTVRRYRIDGGRLVLEGDAGTSTWERAAGKE